MIRTVDMLIDLQYGSTGKGLFAGYIAKKGKYQTVINANMPNAGHTFIDAKGVKSMHKCLPNGIVADSVTRCMIGPGSVFDPQVLEKELRRFNLNYPDRKFTLLIHPGAVALSDFDKMSEETLVGKIGSTAQGSAAAMMRKIQRLSNIREHLLSAMKKIGLEGHVVTERQWQDALKDAHRVLIEGAQGYSLGINQQFYPFTTSRDCTPARFLADCAVPAQMLRKVYGVCRVHPIRVGGNSGDYYFDQNELSWEMLGVEAERTTVTNRERRVFSFSMEQFKDACRECMPDEVFLNFCNYDPDEAERIIPIMNGHLMRLSGGRVAYAGWGAKENEIRELARWEDGDVPN